MNIDRINRLLGFLVLSFLALVCIATGIKAQAAPATQSPEVTALIDRAVIENLMVDYYSYIGNGSFNFGQYFVKDGVLDVNGIVAKGAEEIKAPYVSASGGAATAPPKQDPNAPPPGMFNMQLTNLKVEVRGNTATADMFWSSVESKTLINPPSVTE
jgi:hypothetical protein